MAQKKITFETTIQYTEDSDPIDVTVTGYYIPECIGYSEPGGPKLEPDEPEEFEIHEMWQIFDGEKWEVFVEDLTLSQIEDIEAEGIDAYWAEQDGGKDL